MSAQLKAVSEKENREFLIEQDENVGFYFIVNDRLTGKLVAGHLCDDLEEAFAEAEDLYHIPRELFKPSK